MKRFILAMALAIADLAHAGKRVEPDLVADALVFAQTDRDQAARLLEEALANDSTLADEVRDVYRVHAGEQRRLLGQRDAAWALFRAVVEGGRPAARDAGLLGIDLLDAERGVDADVARRLKEIDEREVIPSQNADRYLLLALFARTSGDDAAAREHYKRSVSWSKDDPALAARIAERWDSGAPVAAPSKSEPVADGTALQRAEAAWSGGRRDDARKLATEAVAAGGPDAIVAKYLLRKLDTAWAADASKIGVILPLSGKYESVGKQIQAALEMGYAGGGRKLVYADVGETTESAVASLERLVFEERVIAVVGPLRSEGAADVVSAADAMRIPILSLAQAVDLPEGRPWVVQGMLTPEDQVRGLLDFAMGARQMDAFAIFAPDNAYGKQAAEVFEAEVVRRGGAVTVKGFYDPTSNNVGTAAQALGRKDYEARKAELSELRKESAKNGGDPSKVVLPPILDFDAMFIPDNAQRVPVACAGLAYEEFPMGEFKPTKSSATFPLLGLSGWNQDVLVTTGGPYVRGGYFTDVYRPGTDPAFDERFRALTGRSPTGLEAVTVDLGALLSAVARGPATTPEAFRDALVAARIDGPISGTNAIGASQVAEHHVRIYTVSAKAIRELDAAELSPPAPPAPVAP